LFVMAIRLRRPSTVYSDPSSIAGLASLLHHPQTVADMRALSGDTTSREVKQNLSGKRYRLGEYQSYNGISRFGIIPAAQSNLYQVNPHNPRPSLPLEHKKSFFSSLLDGVLGVAVLGLLTIIIAYFKDAGNDHFNRFFNLNRFGPRFLLTTIATVIALAWKRVERG
jgi:hypothetical protein